MTDDRRVRVPPGFVLVRLDDLAKLTARQAPVPSVPDCGADSATWSAIAVSVAVLAARLGRVDIRQAELVGDTPPGTVITALAVIAAALMAALLPSDRRTAFLADLGLAAQERTK